MILKSSYSNNYIKLSGSNAILKADDDRLHKQMNKTQTKKHLYVLRLRYVYSKRTNINKLCKYQADKS